MKIRNKHVPNAWELKRMVRGFFAVSRRMLSDKTTRWLYLRNSLQAAMMGPTKFEYAHTVMGSYLHFHGQTDKMLAALDESIRFAEQEAEYPRSTKYIDRTTELPVVSSV